MPTKLAFELLARAWHVALWGEKRGGKSYMEITSETGSYKSVKIRSFPAVHS